MGASARGHYIVYRERFVARILEEDFSRLCFFSRERTEIQLLGGKFHRCLDGGGFLFLPRQDFQIEFLEFGFSIGLPIATILFPLSRRKVCNALFGGNKISFPIHPFTELMASFLLLFWQATKKKIVVNNMVILFSYLYMIPFKSK